MRFKTDENLPADVVEVLRAGGHDASTALDQSLGGTEDALLLVACKREDRVLVTLDTGLADIRAHPPRDNAGIIVLRLGSQDVDHVLSVIRRLLPQLPSAGLTGLLWIVEEDRIRQRD